MKKVLILGLTLIGISTWRTPQPSSPSYYSRYNPSQYRNFNSIRNFNFEPRDYINSRSGYKLSPLTGLGFKNVPVIGQQIYRRNILDRETMWDEKKFDRQLNAYLKKIDDQYNFSGISDVKLSRNKSNRITKKSNKRRKHYSNCW